MMMSEELLKILSMVLLNMFDLLSNQKSQTQRGDWQSDTLLLLESLLFTSSVKRQTYRGDWWTDSLKTNQTVYKRKCNCRNRK